MTNVVPIVTPPRAVKGKHGAITWSIIYNKEARTFKWQVTVPMAPQVFEGCSLSEAQAQTQINAVISKVTKKKGP